LTQLPPRARVARGATYLFAQGFINALFGVIYFVVLTHALSDRPEEMGVFALLFFILMLPQILGTFALPSAAVKFISQYLAENKFDKAKSVVVRILQIGLLSSSVSFLVLFFPAEWLSATIFNTLEYAPLFRVVALTSIFNIMSAFTLGFLQGLQRMLDVAAVNLTSTIIQNSVGIFLLYLGWGLYAVVYSWLAGFFVAFIIGLIITARYLGIFGKSHQIKPLFQFSLPLYIANGVTYFLGWIDQLLLVSYTSLLQNTTEAQKLLGVYNVAIRASAVPSLLSSAVVTALFPQLSELYTQQGFNFLRDAFRMSTRYAVLLGFPLIIGLATLAKPTIILFAGVKYSEAAEPLIIVSISALLGTLGIAINPILMTLKRTKLVSVLSIVSVILSASLSYFTLTILNLGMIGTAWARTIASIIGLILSLYALKRYVAISFDKEALWKSFTASILMVFVIVAIDLTRKFVSSNSYEFLIISPLVLSIYIIVGALVYVTSLIALRAIKKHDIELVKEYLPNNLKYIATWLERIVIAN
jgi:O-antigen/teichoic acid export membrane protein